MPTLITLQTTASTPDNPLDMWQVEADFSDDDKSFDTTAGGEDDDEVVWSVSLPENTNLARKKIEKRLDALTTGQQVTDVARQVLQHLSPTAEAESFDISQADALTDEEGELLQTLYHFSQLNEAESFAPSWFNKLARPATGWNDTFREYQQFMQHSVQLLKPTMRIRTDIGQVLLAQTIVRSDGDMETVWHRGAGPAQMALHRQTTHLTLETRQTLVLFMAQVSAGAASLVAKFYVTQWVALPAAFRFARDVIRRAKEDQLLARLQALQQQKYRSQSS